MTETKIDMIRNATLYGTLAKHFLQQDGGNFWVL